MKSTGTGIVFASFAWTWIRIPNQDPQSYW
jgi:hypothetical protein